LYSTKWSDGEKNKGRKVHSLKKNNSMQDLVESEENGYPVPDPNKIMINVSNEPSDAPKIIPQRGNHGRSH
jgi:hypothetical protein